MAQQNSFLCECGRTIGRMYGGSRHLPWNAEDGEPRHKGINCGGCNLNWLYVKPKDGGYVDVRKCCPEMTCKC
jgi:hypothetical protein